VRRVWVAVSIGLALVVGFTIGLLVRKKLDANWVEAAGTWLVGVVGVVALVVLTFRSERIQDRQDRQRHEADVDEKRDRQQREADVVSCDAIAPSSMQGAEPGFNVTRNVEVRVENNSSVPIAAVECRVPWNGHKVIPFGDEVLRPTEPARYPVHLDELITVHEDFRELRDGVEFFFTLDGVRWSKRHKQPARRLS
jgi:hypothetical protein